MDNNKSLNVVKESFFKKFLNKIKTLFKKAEADTNNYKSETTTKKREFLDSIRVEGNLEMIYLKVKLENGEVKAIDLTDEQIDELQKIYDKEIEEKKNKIDKLKNKTKIS